MTEVRVYVWSSGTGTASGLTYGDPIEVKSCHIARSSSGITLEFRGSARKYPKAQIQIPLDLAEQVAKVMLAQIGGLWNVWDKEFGEEPPA